MVHKVRKQRDAAVVIYVVWSKPHYPFFKAYIHGIWKPTGELTIYSKGNGFYAIKFGRKGYCGSFIGGKPYFYHRKLMIMKRWTSELQLNKEL